VEERAAGDIERKISFSPPTAARER